MRVRGSAVAACLVTFCLPKILQFPLREASLAQSYLTASINSKRADGPEPNHRYYNRGPYTYTSDEGLPTFEYHWTVADHIQAVVDARCRIVKVEEHGEMIEDEYWMAANLDKLPAFLLIVGTKDSSKNLL